ncbi:MAG: 16S rRNA (guanine(527)-N(7))-methyltransferase RsmG [Magnetovibrio sp.]|nr:16S rRNA (guanine(527)-N(7))-methyltransferase RsmG [Magnetovibrio sp.]|tara:strand:- start:1730 stop:2404 length:675 start_codon:yes stop_codon:yes gene_type:complete
MKESRSSIRPLKPKDFQKLTKASDSAVDNFKTYLDLLRHWQSKINLVGASTLEDPWWRHFLDCAQLYPLLAKQARVIVDVGSGAGFPALVLAILDVDQHDSKQRDQREYHLIESNKRKCIFLREINRLVGLPVVVHDLRAENYSGPLADIVTARACASLNALLALSAPLMKRDGRGLFLKGAKYRDELTLAKKDWKMSVKRRASETNSKSVILQVENLVRIDGI